MSAKARVRPRKSPRQARSRETVAAVLEAATRILVRRGYEELTTNAIASEAGVSVGSLYQYYPGKEAIVAALVARHFEEEVALVQEKIAGLMDAPLAVAVPELVRALLLAHKVNPRLKRVFLEQLPRVGQLQRVRETRRYVEDRVVAYFERHAAEIRRRDARLLAFVLVTALDAILQVAKSERPEYLEDERLVNEVGELVLRYLAR